MLILIFLSLLINKTPQAHACDIFVLLVLVFRGRFPSAAKRPNFSIISQVRAAEEPFLTKLPSSLNAVALLAFAILTYFRVGIPLLNASNSSLSILPITFLCLSSISMS